MGEARPLLSRAPGFCQNGRWVPAVAAGKGCSPLGEMAATLTGLSLPLYLGGPRLAIAGDFPPLPPSGGRADRKRHQSVRVYYY